MLCPSGGKLWKKIYYCFHSFKKNLPFSCTSYIKAWFVTCTTKSVSRFPHLNIEPLLLLRGFIFVWTFSSFISSGKSQSSGICYLFWCLPLLVITMYISQFYDLEAQKATCSDKFPFLSQFFGRSMSFVACLHWCLGLVMLYCGQNVLLVLFGVLSFGILANFFLFWFN